MSGLLIVGVALFSSEMGLNPNWNKGRIAILILGLLVALLPWITWKKPDTREQIFQTDFFAFPALLIVIAIYLWFISISHGSTSNYYALLGKSFREGELSLPLRPDPALLALSDPYDPAAREGIKAPLDLSLYKGKFYLYWGPAPALFLAIIEPLFSGKISDGYLLFVFVCGSFLSQFLLITHLWERFFPEIPKWIVILSIFVAGCISPTLWLLSQPKIYETAIAGGQFFFIAGLFLAFTALDYPTPSSWRLVLAGIFWGLAVGTRSVLVFPVVFMTLMMMYWLYRIYHPSWPKFVTGFVPLGVPLIVGAVAFAWYNWARFDSVSETGFTYALAGPYLQKHLNELFLPTYVFQNLYNYLLNPSALKGQFPFFSPVRGKIEAILPWQVLPEIYSAQAITGILWAASFTMFAVISASIVFRKNQTSYSNENLKTISLYWITIGLIGSFLIAFTSLLTFFWAAMRYTVDFMPTLTLLSIIGFWHGYKSLFQSPSKRKIYVILGVILAGISIITGVLPALSIFVSNGLL